MDDNFKRSRFFRYQLPAIAWAGLIFILSSIPHLSPPDVGVELSDKLAHVVEYGIFGYLLVRALLNFLSARSKVYASILAIIIGVFWALTDEIHQSFISGREASKLDFLADGIGVVIAQGVFWAKGRLFRDRSVV